MKWKNRILFSLFCCLFLGGCFTKGEQKYEDSRFLFGTYIKIVTYAEKESVAKEAMQAAFDEIERIDKKFNSKREESLIYQLNHAEISEVALDQEGVFLFQEVKKAYDLSHKKYDITISPLLELWGFEKQVVKNLPDSETLKESLSQVDFNSVQWKNGTLKIQSPAKEIDTGSFLKGYAIEQGKKKMQEKGIQSAFISSISSIALLGTKLEGKAWRIALENPEDPEEILGVLSLEGQALGVSGDYQTYLEIQGKRYHHILDKTTGYPVADKKMVAVICKDGLEADIYSTTFFLMPIQEVLDYVNQKEEMEVLIVDQDMNFHMSEHFEKYFSKK